MYFCVLWCNIPTKAFAASLLRFLYYTQLYTHTHTRVRLLLTCDQLLSEAATFTIHNICKRRKSMLSAGFETTTAAIENDGRIASQTARSPNRLCKGLGACQNTSKLIWDIMLCGFIYKGVIFQIAFAFTGEKQTLKCLQVLRKVPKFQLYNAN